MIFTSGPDITSIPLYGEAENQSRWKSVYSCSSSPSYHRHCMGLVHLAFPFGLYGTVDLFFQMADRYPAGPGYSSRSIPKPNGFYVGSLSFDKGGPGDEDIEFQVGIGQWVRHHGGDLEAVFLERRKRLADRVFAPEVFTGCRCRNNGGIDIL